MITGPTGSGKTTLVSLLLRLYDPQRGAIRIDGQDLRRFRVASVRDCVAIALQENRPGTVEGFAHRHGRGRFEAGFCRLSLLDGDVEKQDPELDDRIAVPDATLRG